MSVSLFDYQEEAMNRLTSGCILCGGVGSGKSRTAIAYYFCKECDGGLHGTKLGLESDYIPMKNPKDLYIITTARKRDTKEWEKELLPFLISANEDSLYYEDMELHIDSWNNVKKYVDVKNAFFIFDEQRVVGYGTWTKSFLKITSNNRWILLSATPGDTWMDYMPVFIANGFYRNKSDFINRHVVYKRFAKFPQVERYLDQKRLIKQRDTILVTMDYKKPTVSHYLNIEVGYDKTKYKDIMARRWNIFEDMPISNAAELCYVAREVINSDPTRREAIIELQKLHPRIIIFYNYNYERDILRSIDFGTNVKRAEWNGDKHEPIPDSEEWVYLVQYFAGAEGWNCIETDTIIFYSLNYSYKIMVQSAGRIDRMNTPYTDLYYYRLRSNCPLDLAISRALKRKQNFNESKFISS